MRGDVNDSESVSVKDIVLLPEMQPRTSGYHLPTLRKYRDAMDAGDEFPPILLARFEGALVLVDGWHRLEAQQRLGRFEVVAQVREAESREEAKLWAFEANRKHGLPLKKTELREMFRVYLKAGRHRRQKGRRFKSYREMAEELGIPKSTIANWTRQDAPALAKALSESQPFACGRRGGAREVSAGKRLARVASGALDEAAAAIAGVGDPQERWRLLEQAQGIVRALEEGNLQRPMF